MPGDDFALLIMRGDDFAEPPSPAFVPPPELVCAACGETLPVERFSHSQLEESNGRWGRCISCVDLQARLECTVSPVKTFLERLFSKDEAALFQQWCNDTDVINPNNIPIYDVNTLYHVLLSRYQPLPVLCRQVDQVTRLYPLHTAIQQALEDNKEQDPRQNQSIDVFRQGIQQIYLADPEVIGFPHPVTGLLPFQMAAAASATTTTLFDNSSTSIENKKRKRSLSDDDEGREEPEQQGLLLECLNGDDERREEGEGKQVGLILQSLNDDDEDRVEQVALSSELLNRDDKVRDEEQIYDSRSKQQLGLIFELLRAYPRAISEKLMDPQAMHYDPDFYSGYGRKSNEIEASNIDWNTVEYVYSDDEEDEDDEDAKHSLVQ